MESHCNHSRRKLDLGGVKRYREYREKNKEVEKRGLMKTIDSRTR